MNSRLRFADYTETENARWILPRPLPMPSPEFLGSEQGHGLGFQL